ncbi:4,5:9,10-diseco-3-hydroxy-5,9, 17-trioxoandrosta-1(10),2-diene-4-oate hydrolase [Arthrobacter saudimassiliensis]|uniref:4,5:9,10-diseco-3-hydroxy-5,9, 17-trioxoandrosta-1(10),2-diene-4-oate hydrolase n=1 Tax=Arthrobacter saudimassiliensis TaxID=1461584 RepID=A0A078MPY2_9MICC|nr:4,5:9,10-diseco-3-hydroxy-5,9, 17-trioxoandrosta-1(10),2-diene-4-oate hydrolase [Arthrobacter saudimassiliensis]
MTRELPTLWQEIGDLPHQLSYLDVGPWRTRVLSVGANTPERETIVLMAGTSGHLEAFTHNIRALAADYHVIAYDYPGHGFSTLAAENLEIADYEDHLLGLLDLLGLDRAHLCGESLGGWIALKFAQKHPERVRTLILSAPGGQVISQNAMGRARSISRDAVAEPSFANVKARLQVVIHDPELISDELVRMRQAVYARDGFAASMDHIMALQQPDIRFRNRVTEEDYAAVPVPVLLVWTDHEPSGGVDTGERFAAALPDGELLVIRNAAHWPQWEDPRAFNERALDFLARKG